MAETEKERNSLGFFFSLAPQFNDHAPPNPSPWRSLFSTVQSRTLSISGRKQMRSSEKKSDDESLKRDATKPW